MWKIKTLVKKHFDFYLHYWTKLYNEVQRGASRIRGYKFSFSGDLSHSFTLCKSLDLFSPKNYRSQWIALRTIVTITMIFIFLVLNSIAQNDSSNKTMSLLLKHRFLPIVLLKRPLPIQWLNNMLVRYACGRNEYVLHVWKLSYIFGFIVFIA